jgi:hypothetical protein
VLLYYYIIIYLIHYYTIILYLILFSSLPLLPPQYSFYTCRYLHILIYILLLSSPILLFSSSDLSSIHLLYNHLPSPSQPSIHLILSLLLFFPPNIHSILVGTYIYLFIFYQYLPGHSDPARSIGVDG